MLKQFIDLCIDRRRAVVCAIVAISIPMLFWASNVHVGTSFADLVPAKHPYVAVHNAFKTTYGSSNAVTIVMENERGDVFQTDFLQRLRAATLQLRNVEGVNAAQVVSLASRKLKHVRASTDGLETTPLMPDVPDSQQGLEALKERVLRNELVYGRYVSRDLKAALISVDFYDHLLRPAAAFSQMRTVMASVTAPGIRVRMIGEPVLAGWVAFYLSETLAILAATLVAAGALLFLLTRSWRGTLLPGLAGLLSAVWTLGIAGALEIALDPLAIVVAFLITARAISHSVQLVMRFDDEVRAGAKTATEAAKGAMLGLFKPGMLGVVADAACMLVIVLMPIPLIQKIAFLGAAWMLSIALSAVVLTPVLLSWVRRPLRYAHALDLGPLLGKCLDALAHTVCGRPAYWIVGAAAVVFVASCRFAFDVPVGDASPGSALLQRNSPYNVDAAEINRRFPGADSLFVVLSGTREDGVKNPAALQALARLQVHMEALPQIGASVSLADLVSSMRRMLRDGNHRYQERGRTEVENGELLYMLASGADASDIERFADRQFKSAAVTFFFRDRLGETIRAGLVQLRSFVESQHVEGFTWLIAGGSLGIAAAVNEVILAGHIQSIALALLALALICAFTYRSLSAGIFFMAPVLLANALTFSFMAWRGIGLDIHTLPIAALGIGLGVDYSFYVVDAMREALRRGAPLQEAARRALGGAGKGVFVTAGALIVSLAVWGGSSLRFQSEMALLMAVWLLISASAALLLMPALAAVFKPRFLFR